MSDNIVYMFACQPCALGYHWECASPVEGHEGTPNYFCCCTLEARLEKGVYREAEDDEREITNNLTTGRKRAGRLVPIMTGMVCEWSHLRYAGGGIMPIVGCDGNKLAKVKRGADLPPGIDSRGELHHGPDKATLNNAPGSNLHRICSECHHRWHALNDRYYDKVRPAADQPWVPEEQYGRVWPHDPISLATEEQMDTSEEWWNLRTENRPEYPFGRESESVVH